MYVDDTHIFVYDDSDDKFYAYKYKEQSLVKINTPQTALRKPTTKTKSANYTLATDDFGDSILCTATLTLTLPSSLPIGYDFWVINGGTGTVTVDPEGSGLIDGSTTYSITTGHTIKVQKVTASSWAVTSGRSTYDRMFVERFTSLPAESWNLAGHYRNLGRYRVCSHHW